MLGSSNPDKFYQYALIDALNPSVIMFRQFYDISYRSSFQVASSADLGSLAYSYDIVRTPLRLKAQRPEVAFPDATVWPELVPGQVDMLPTQW